MDWLAETLALARTHDGQTGENPSVGCILVRDNKVVGQGVTAPGGRPHAETEALAQAGDRARGATAYVTLEPCSHFGHTPPCADALLKAGVAHVVIGMIDPDRRVRWQGAARLQEAGVDVVVDGRESVRRFYREYARSRIGR